MKDSTIALHGAFDSDPATNAVAVPIYQTVAYSFDDAQHGADLFNLAKGGNIYTRLMNPTTGILEARIAELEGGVAALGTASGSSALHYTFVTLAKAGQNIVSSSELYGGTYTLLKHFLPGLGIDTKFAENFSAQAIEAQIDENTRAVFVESLGNPSGNIADLEAIAEVAHRHGVPLVVDNTVPTPILCKPIEHGADIVVHSLTKYIGGHGNSLGGAIVDGGTFPWADYADKFTCFSQPEPGYHGVVYNDAAGDAGIAFALRARTVALRNTGAALAPHSAFLLLQGLETLALRMERHTENAQKVAEYLDGHDKVEWVRYAGLASSPQQDLAAKYLKSKPSGLLSFGVKGGSEAGVKVHDSLNLFKRLVNIGDAKSLVCHPASTTHRQLNESELEAAGVTPELLRLSVGIEDIEDIIADLEQALATI